MPNWIRLRGALLLFVAAASTPLHLYGANPIGIARPERVVLLIAGVWLIGMLVVWLLATRGMSVAAAENTSFIAVALVMGGGALFSTFGSVVALALVIGLILLAGWAFQRFVDHWLTSTLVIALATAVAVGPVAAFIESLSEDGGPSVVVPIEQLEIEMTTTPDVFLIVLDGYPGQLSMAQDGIGPGRVDLVDSLEQRGFDVPISWSSYWTTTLSIPSLLTMDYPVESADWYGLASRAELQEVISGNNQTLRAFEDNGYTSHMIESGWSGSSCGPEFDNCVPAPLIDDATYLMLYRTAGRPLLRRSPGPFALGTLSGFDWLFDHTSDLSANGRPDFVFMHVVSPHSPYLLSSDCSFRLGAESPGVHIVDRELSDRRSQPLVDQMDCVDGLMVRLSDLVSVDDIVVFVSDHGPGRRGQTGLEGEWGHEEVVERMNNFAAVRMPGECQIGDGVLVPNLMRHVFACTSGGDVELLAERMWVNPMAELDDAMVLSLIGTAAPSD